MVVFQVDRLPLDLVLQDGVDAAVADRLLVRIVNLHGPDKSLVDHLNSAGESGRKVIDEETSLLGIAKRPGLGSL